MELARILHMTRQQLFENTTSSELTDWRALYAIEAEEQKKRALLDKAHAARKGR
jgi:hypothetical protein